VPLPDAPSVYAVPLMMEEAGLDEYLCERLGLPRGDHHGPGLDGWRELVSQIRQPRRAIPIALVGKYVELRDAYLSVAESLRHAALVHGADVDIHWISSEELESTGPDDALRYVKGIVVPGGFGNRGIEGMIATARYARTHRIPYFGLCLGMQIMVIEAARSLLGLARANSTEFDADTPHPVIDLMPDQHGVVDRGGTMRLGRYPCCLVPGTLAASAYRTAEIAERHRHRFEFNNRYREALAGVGLIASGLSPDGRLVEIAEYRDHPWMLGTQFHPEFKSRPDRAHPLFRDFVAAASRVIREGEQAPLPLGVGSME
jgi:CTP synthase